MMSRYSDGPSKFDYTPPSSPRGRRYILKNLNARKQKKKVTFPVRKDYDEYLDIQKAPSTQGSVNSKTSSHIGPSNKVLPTETPKDKSPRKETSQQKPPQNAPVISPRKHPREPPRFVSPRKDPEAYAKEQTPFIKDENDNVTKAPSEKGGSKEDDSKNKNKSPRKDKQEAKSKENKDNKDTKDKNAPDTMPVSSRSEKGLTPRDEYMVNKLYDSKSIIYLKPSEVRYTHDQITSHFTDGRSMLSTFIAILYGRLEIRLGGNDVPPVEVMHVEEPDGKLWYVVNGNRRLFIFRRLERCGAIDTMQVVARKYDTVEMDKHFLTRNHGRTISVTNDAQLNVKMKKEVQKWREKGGHKRVGQRPGKWKPPGHQPPHNKSSCCVVQ